MRGLILALLVVVAAAWLERPSFGTVRTPRSLDASSSLSPLSPLSLPRGGEAVSDLEIPYSPNLLTAKIREHRKSKATSCKTDSTVSLSAAKAKEVRGYISTAPPPASAPF